MSARSLAGGSVCGCGGGGERCFRVGRCLLKPAEVSGWKEAGAECLFFFFLAQCCPSCAVRCGMSRRLRLGGGDAPPRGGYRLDGASSRFRSSSSGSRGVGRGRGMAECCWRTGGDGLRAGGNWGARELSVLIVVVVTGGRCRARFWNLRRLGRE